jgi:Abi-like protein
MAALERFITRERLTYYLEQGNDDLGEAIRLYELNTRLSAVLYGPVQGLEVLVRNAMNEQLSVRFGDDWHDLRTIRLAAPQQDDVQKAIREIEGDVTNGAVVAELSLGFWAALLNTSNDNEIWRKALYLSFPHRPRGTERKAIHGALNSIRRLRNRIAHHEKILHRDLADDHARIIEIAGWICPETRDWIASLSEFDPIMLPVSEDGLPFDMPLLDVTTPSKEQGPTLNGRPRLSLGQTRM